MKNNPAKGPRSAPRRVNRQNAGEARETAADRFEFARRHIIHQDKLQGIMDDATKELYNWLRRTPEGFLLAQPMYTDAKPRLRKAHNPEERAELKALESAVIAARARLLLHENDGRNL